MAAAVSEDDPQIALLAEQLSHALDLVKARMATIEADAQHKNEFYSFRLKTLEDQAADHETRIRSSHDGVTQFKFMTGLASVASGILAVIAFIKSLFFGG
jgi:hypothetical protein